MGLKRIGARIAGIWLILLLLWPIFHMIACRTFGFSSWRLFGWGMYATPHPEASSRLELIFSSQAEPALTPVVAALAREETPRDCLGVWRIDADGQARAVETALCEDPRLEELVSAALHFRSRQTFLNLIKAVESEVPSLPPPVGLVQTQQRLSVLRSLAWLQRKVFRVQGDSLRIISD